MTAPKKPEKSLAAFRQLYDPNIRIPAQLRAGLESLLKEYGPEAWEYELEFMRRCGVNTTQIAMFREQFEKHTIIVRVTGKSEKRVWFADAKIAAKARGE